MAIDDNNIDALDASVLNNSEYTLESSSALQGIKDASSNEAVDQAALNALADQERVLSGVRSDLEALIANMRSEGLDTGDVEGQLANVAAAYQTVSSAMSHPTASNVSTALATGNQVYNTSSSAARTSKADALALAASAALAYNLGAMAIEQAKEIAFFASDTFAGLTQGIQNLILPEIDKNIDAQERESGELAQMLVGTQAKERVFEQSRDNLEKLEALAQQHPELHDYIDNIQNLRNDTGQDPVYLENLSNALDEFEQTNDVERLKNTLNQSIHNETMLQENAVLESFESMSLASRQKIDEEIRTQYGIEDGEAVTREQQMEYLETLSKQGFSTSDQDAALQHIETTGSGKYADKNAADIKSDIDARFAQYDTLSEAEKNALDADIEAWSYIEKAQAVTVRDIKQMDIELTNLLQHEDIALELKTQMQQTLGDNPSQEQIQAYAQENKLEYKTVETLATKDLDTIKTEMQQRKELGVAEAEKNIQKQEQAERLLIEQGQEPTPENVEKVLQDMQQLSISLNEPVIDIPGLPPLETEASSKKVVNDWEFGLGSDIDYDISHIKFEALNAEQAQTMLDTNEATTDILENGTITEISSDESQALSNMLNQQTQNPEVQQQIQHSNNFAAMLQGEEFTSDALLTGNMDQGEIVAASTTPQTELGKDRIASI